MDQIQDQSQEQQQQPINIDRFAKPIEIAKTEYTHFEMREATVNDMLDAELVLSNSGRGTHTPLAFNGEMMVRQLVRVFNESGQEFSGPFTFAMLRNWGTRNYRALRETQVKVDVLGEG